jgi:D-amino-acid dehydrogenase
MSKHVVIVGAGIVGLSTAYFCARRGHRVTLIDRSPAMRDGCSFGNAGMIVPSHFTPLAAPGMVATGLKWMWNPESPFYIKPRFDRDLLGWGYKFWRAATKRHVDRCAPLLRDLNFAGRTCYEELAASENGEDFGLVRRGLVMLCKTPHALEEEIETANRARELGIPAEVLDRAGIAALEPDVEIDVAGGVLYPRDCHLSPNRLMAALQRRCEADGARFHWNTEVVDWRSEGKRLAAVKTTSGEIQADEFVLAAGVWSDGLARGLQLNLPMQAGKGYSLTLDSPRQLPKVCAILTEARVAVTPMGGSLRFGGTMEIAGIDETINARRVRGIINSAQRYFPAFRAGDFVGVQPWCGLRPCSPDGMPYLGRTSKHRNLVVATGHAMMGLSLGAISGKIVASLIGEELPEFDLALVSPDRFG